MRRSLLSGKTRWPPVFSLSQRTPMLIEGTTRQVGSPQVCCVVSRQPLWGEGGTRPPTTLQTPPTQMEKILYAIMNTALLSLKQFQGRRRRPHQLRSPLQDYRPAAGIPPVASPASSWVESQPTTPPNIHSSLNSSYFIFFFKQGTRPICLYHRNPIWCRTDTRLLHNPKCIVLIPLFWKLFCTVFIVYLFVFDRSTLCISNYMVQSLPLSL